MITSKKTLGIVIPVHRKADLGPSLVKFLRDSDDERVQIAIAVNNDSTSVCSQLENSLKSLGTKNLTVALSNRTNAGNARNVALQNLNTDWICFLDADDLLNLENCLSLIQESVAFKPDLIIGSIRIQKFDDPYKFKDHFLIENFDGLEGLGILPAFTRIIYRSEFLSGVFFPEFRIAEDQIFLIQVLMKKPKIRYRESHLYTYFVGEASQSTNDVSKYPDLVLALTFLSALFSKSKIGDRELIILFMVRIYFSILKRFRFVGFRLLLSSTNIAFKLLLRHPLRMIGGVLKIRKVGGIALE